MTVRITHRFACFHFIKKYYKKGLLIEQVSSYIDNRVRKYLLGIVDAIITVFFPIPEKTCY